MRGTSPVRPHRSVPQFPFVEEPLPTRRAGRQGKHPPGREGENGARRGAGAEIAFRSARLRAEAAAPRGAGKPRLSGRRRDELWSWLVCFPQIFARGGAYKYYSRAPGDTGVSLSAGAKPDLALSGSSDAYLSARRRVGTQPSPARRGRRCLSKY